VGAAPTGAVLAREREGRWRSSAPLPRGSRLLRILQSAVDLAVVVHSIVLATLSHASYMVPNTADLFGP
jgi:hypothetical protein